MSKTTESAPGIRLALIPISQVLRWDKNPKRHDMGAIIQSIEKHGFREPPVFDKNLNGGEGGVASGNGRTEALWEMMKAGYAVPRNIAVDEKTGEWAMPVIMGGDAESERAAAAFALDANNLTLLGGDFGPLELARMWEGEAYAEVLADLANHGELPVSVDGEDVDALIAELAAGTTETENGLREEYSPNVGEVVYEPKETHHKPADLFDGSAANRFESEIVAITDKDIQNLLRARAAFFTVFNFAKIADYYAYQATPGEKALFEKLALVLLDRDGLIQNGFAAIVEEVKEENGFNDVNPDDETDD